MMITIKLIETSINIQNYISELVKWQEISHQLLGYMEISTAILHRYSLVQYRPTSIHNMVICNTTYSVVFTIHISL